MFRSFGLPEIIIILGILALLFGASRLPQMGNSLGRGIREFKNGIMGKSDDEEPKVSESSKSRSETDSGKPLQH
ncbi:MAG: twin-arginine translocase TatA/TatE family subunit [Chloroflexi bacterium]|nr:twin-arginine translocase TatA/TatE family subunit [Chloroflexota bacterium]MCH8194960.1 twin-arginine translocase TatA/TatE family subunit [Chloroflexota bacterium]MCH8283669.1 twin-arginine translocase TatA/TatE family subunit [Chloroflexota bacterium]